MKHKRTEREFHIALGKLLERVRIQNNWSVESFKEATKHTANIIASEGIRFQKAMIELNLIVPGTNKKTLKPNFDIIVWRNSDRMLSFIKDIIEMHPDIVQKRGKKSIKSLIGNNNDIDKELLPTIIQEDIINPFESFTDSQLAQELRNRGYIVEAYKQVIIIERV